MIASHGHAVSGTLLLQRQLYPSTACISSYSCRSYCPTSARSVLESQLILDQDIKDANQLLKNVKTLDRTSTIEQPDAQSKMEGAARTASTLSNYCLYLLAFSPQLLSDNCSITSECILDQSIDEARKRLKGAKTLQERCNKLMEISTSNDGDGDEALPLVQGARLARTLIGDIKEPALRWKVLSDFWAEMMLYVSPSDDARAHLEVLARGGEFITHIWALLTHGGVQKRCPPGPQGIV